jgi:hypothetical protein
LNRISVSLFLLLTLTLTEFRAEAATVSEVRGKKIILRVESGEQIQARQKFNIEDPDSGRNLGQVEITRRRGSRAVAKLLKGRAKTGAVTVSLRSRRHRDDSFVDKDDEYRSRRRTPASLDNPFENTQSYQGNEAPNAHPRKARWGFGMGITPTTIRVSDSTGSNTLRGNNFLVRVAYDKPFHRKFTIMLGAGLFPISGTQADDSLGTAKMEAEFLSFEGNLRLHPTGNAQQGPWFGSGLNYLRVSRASSNVVSESSITNRTVLQLSAGYNMRMGSEYLMFRGDMMMHSGADSSVSISQSVFSAIYFFD